MTPQGSKGRIVVIGAGVIGLMCGYELRKRGAEVIILDKSQPGSACSFGNAGWIVPSISTPLAAPGLTLNSFKWMLRRNSPFYIAPRSLPKLAGWLWSFWRHCNERDFRAGVKALAELNRATMALYDELERDGIECEMERAGVLFLFLSESAMRHALEDLSGLDQLGYQPPQPLLGDEIRELEPALSGEVAAGFWVEEERHLRPETLTAGLVKWLAEQGVELCADAEILGGIRQGKRLTAITTPHGPVTGDRFLIAAGAWSGLLASRLGFELPIQAGKGYSITFDNPVLKIQRPLYLDEAKVACSPFKGALRLSGTMELSGINSSMRQQRISGIRRAASRYLKDFAMSEGHSEWMGLRPLTPDGLPVIGRVPGFDNLYLATGHQMLGVTLAPATASAIADLIWAGRTNLDLGAFDPARFTNGYRAAM